MSLWVVVQRSCSRRFHQTESWSYLGGQCRHESVVIGKCRAGNIWKIVDEYSKRRETQSLIESKIWGWTETKTWGEILKRDGKTIGELENWSSKSGWSHLFRVQCKMPSEVEFCYHEQQWPTLRAMICNRAQGWSWKNDLSPIQVKTSTYSHDKIWTTVTRRDCKLRQKKGQHQCMSVCLLKVIHVEVPFTRGFTESFRNIAWSLSWS